MALGTLVGVVLLASAALEVLVGLLVIAPRLPAEKRPVILAALLSSSFMMALLGAAFLFDWIPLG